MLKDIELTDGPCAGQIVHVPVGIGGYIPREFMACRPAEHREGPAPAPEDYHRYVRVGGYQSTTYTYIRHPHADAEQ